METTWITLAVAAVVVGIAGYALRRNRRQSAHKELNEQVQTWEDEGGNVPEVPTAGPRPPPPPTRDS